MVNYNNYNKILYSIRIYKKNVLLYTFSFINTVENNTCFVGKQICGRNYGRISFRIVLELFGEACRRWSERLALTPLRQS